MSPAARRDQVDTSLASHARFGPQKPTAVLRVFEIMVGVTFSHLPAGVMTQASGSEGGYPWDIRWITHCRRASLGHKIGSPDAVCPIFSADVILMGCECQPNKVGVLEVAFQGFGCKDATAVTEVSIFEA